MKKNLIRAASALLAAVFALLCVPVVFADADCEFALSSVTVSEHTRTVTVKLSVTTNVPVASAHFLIDMPEGFGVASISPKAGAASPKIEQTEEGDILFVLEDNGSPLSGSADLALIVVSLPESKFSGEVFSLPIQINSNDVLDADKVKVNTLVSGGVITVEGAVIYGDVNCDCSINAKDVTQIMRRLVNASTVPHFDVAAADVYLDEKLNSRDVTQLMKYLIGVPTVRPGHHDVIEILEPATCQKKGLARLTCSVCNDSVEVVIPVGDHDYELGICKNCSKKHPDYPVIVYTDFLKRNGSLETALRGFALYKSVATKQYKLFESNICDSKNGSLVLYGVGTFDNGLICYVTVEIAHVGAPYKLHYDAYNKDVKIASALGTLEADKTVTFSETEGMDASKTTSHLKIAQSITKNLLTFTSSMIENTGLGISLADFALTDK